MAGRLNGAAIVWTLAAAVTMFVPFSALVGQPAGVPTPVQFGARMAVELATAPPEVVTFQTPTTRWATPFGLEFFVRTWNVQVPAGNVTPPAPSTSQPLLSGVAEGDAVSVGGVIAPVVAGATPGEKSR